MADVNQTSAPSDPGANLEPPDLELFGLSIRSSHWEQFKSILVAVFIALLVRSSIVEAFWVPSGSMLPTIQIGDHLFVNKVAYCLRVPFLGTEVLRYDHVDRGEIVVFSSPPSNPGPDGDPIDLIKRVVAIPGDTVEIRGKVLYLNGEQAEDPKAHFVDDTHHNVAKRDNMPPIVVPPGKFFVMGDNRDQSFDSRYWGFANEADVKGRATFIYWSRASGSYLPRWERFGLFLR